MLETRNGLVSTQELEQLLQQSLIPHNVGIVPRKITCLLRDHNLMILLHYQQPAMPYPRKLFAVLKDNLDKLLISPEYQVLMYLVVQDKYNNLLASTTPPVALPTTPQILLQTPAPVTLPTQVHHPFKLPKFALAGVGVVAAIFLVYLTGRHCLLGNNCALIPQANNLAKQAQLIVDYTPTDLTKAVTELNNAQNLLESIPSFSPHYPEAQNLVKNYQQQAQTIENILKAESITTKALSLTQLPVSIEEYQQIESLWLEAKAILETIPSQGSLANLVQPRLDEINREKTAITSLKTAQEAEQLAKVRESVARSLENWQLVLGTWRTALLRLESIPPDSKIANEVEIRQLTAIYESRLAQTNQIVQQETITASLYQQAQNQAKLAQTSINNQQWQAAVNYWRQALEIITQIPAESSMFADAQTLTSDYQQSLQQAQSQQAVALNLDQICSINIKICNYKIATSVIKVELTPIYQEQLHQVALATTAQSNAPAQMELRQHLSGLETVFQSISNNTGIPVEIYDAQQVLIVTYLPM
jgi:hypothetical protein